MKRNFLMIGLAIFSSIFAQAQTFISNTQPLYSSGLTVSQIHISGSFGDQGISPLSGSNIDMQVDFDADNGVATFRQTTVNLNETINVSGDFSSGPGTITISGMIEFDATLQFLDDQALSLTASDSLPNHFLINNFGGSLGRSEQTRITGSYSLSGPTQSASGTFSVSPFWWRSNTPRVDTTDFPNSVMLHDHPYWWTDTDENLFSETIDGVDLSVDLNNVFSMNTAFWSPDSVLTIIPESSTYAFASVICLIGFVAFRRMKLPIKCKGRF